MFFVCLTYCFFKLKIFLGTVFQQKNFTAINSNNNNNTTNLSYGENEPLMLVDADEEVIEEGNNLEKGIPSQKYGDSARELSSDITPNPYSDLIIPPSALPILKRYLTTNSTSNNNNLSYSIQSQRNLILNFNFKSVEF